MKGILHPLTIKGVLHPNQKLACFELDQKYQYLFEK